MSKTTYLSRKNEGLCVVCGGAIEADRKGKTSCLSCTKQMAIDARLDREYRKSLGLCPRCGKHKLIGNERNCPECRAKNAYYRARQRENNPDAEAIYIQHSKENRKVKYHKRKEQGLCVGCGNKLKDCDKGHSYCARCRGINNANKVKSPHNSDTYLQHIWKMQGLCPMCGNPLYEKHGLCKRHYDMQIAAHDYKKIKKAFIRGNQNGL